MMLLIITVFLSVHLKMGDSTSPLKKKACSSTDLELFDEVFPKLVSDIVENGLQQSEVKDALSWFKKVNLTVAVVRSIFT